MLASVMDWCLLSRSLTETGARVAAVRHWLAPTHSGYSTYREIAEAAGLSRAAVSKWMVDLRASLGGHLPPPSDKRDFAKESYRKAQKAAVAAGVHSSQKKPKPGDKRFGPRKPSISGNKGGRPRKAR
jgi:hypothetical protein